MAASDIRQGRAGREDVGALIRGLRLMADAGRINGPRDKAALRQAAGMLEKRAFQAGNQDKDWEGLLGECAALRDRCAELEEQLAGVIRYAGLCDQLLKELGEAQALNCMGRQMLQEEGTACLPGGISGSVMSLHDQMIQETYKRQRAGIDFEAPAPVTW